MPTATAGLPATPPDPSPQTYPSLTFEFDPDSNILFAVLGRAAVEQKLDEQSIGEALAGSPYQAFQREADALPRLLKAVSTLEEGRFEFARKLDATLVVDLSDDNMQAFVSTTPAHGGANLAYQDVVAALDKAKVAPGFRDEKAIAVLLKEAANGAVVDKKLFATGVPSVPGVDGKLVFLVSEIVRKKLAEDAHGVVDFHELNEFVIVEPGTPVLRRIPPTPGEEGCDVLGNPVPAMPGKDFQFSKEHSGAILDPGDENLLIAEIKGHPLLFRDSLKVDPVLHLREVNLKTGNISFDGSVNVAGDVGVGMAINASGNVNVSGVVEKATVIAGNNIVVGGGVIGGELSKEEKKKMETAGMDPEEKTRMFCKSHLQAGGSISAKYISMTDVTCGQDISVGEYILNSAVNAKGELQLGQLGGKGCLIGGYCHAPGGIKVNVLGNEAYAKTHVTVGHPKELTAKYIELHESIEQKTAVLTKLQEGLLKLEKTVGPDSAGHVVHEQISKIKNALPLLQAQIDEQKKLFEEVHAEIQQSAAVRVSARQKTYPNVYLCINGVEKRVEEAVDGGSFFADYKHIKFEK